MFWLIRALKLNKPVLVGHSIAGAELSSVATLDPKHIAGVVYLEAAYPYAFDNGKGPSMKAFQEIPLPQFPSPAESDLRSFSALQKWDAQVYGFRLPESEFHQKWDSTPDGKVTSPRDFQGSQYLMTVLMVTKKYAKIPIPTLPSSQSPTFQKPGWPKLQIPVSARQSTPILQTSIFWQKNRQRWRRQPLYRLRRRTQ